ncbi:MAG: DUF177 domain-containing protein [Bacteroidales bacterium]|nr:DUF177 domain-containing protein [Bacteroidales bacterium]
MSRLSQYDIHFSGLKPGKHEFEYEINKDFFSFFENEDIVDADISVLVNFEKNERYLALEFDLQGVVKTICDRCLENIELEIDYTPGLYVNFGDETSDLTDIDDTMVLSRSADKIELAKHLYDYICLNLPIQKVHPEDENGESTCNQEMIKKIEQYQLGNVESEETDPRWDKLKNLFN